MLRLWRSARKLSQLDLSLSAGISQRHVSFLESGRASPSRAMVQQLAEVLDIPLRERNRLLTAAGFAARFEARTLDHPAMAAVMQALRITLKHHEPNPAIVVDRNWDLLLANDALLRLLSRLDDLEQMWARTCPDGSRNVLKLTFHPRGLRDHLRNWREVAPLMLARIRREAELQVNETLADLIDEILGYPDVPRHWDFRNPPTPPPILPLEFIAGERSVRLISMISSFDRAQDVTTDELRIEHFFPADGDSAAFLQRLAEAAPVDRSSSRT